MNQNMRGKMMKTEWHYLPELPNRSCEVLVLHYRPQYGKVFVQQVKYSQANKLFNTTDKDNSHWGVYMHHFSDSVYAWAYVDETKTEFLARPDLIEARTKQVEEIVKNRPPVPKSFIEEFEDEEDEENV